jgi:hypothetical protein
MAPSSADFETRDRFSRNCTNDMPLQAIGKPSLSTFVFINQSSEFSEWYMIEMNGLYKYE